MLDPATISSIGALVVSGLGGVLGNVIGNTADRELCLFTSEIASRIGGLTGFPRNHEAPRAIRRAQLQALDRITQNDFLDSLPDWSSDRFSTETFCLRIRGWVRKSLPICSSIEIDDKLSDRIAKCVTISLAGPERPTSDRAGQCRRDAEDAVLDELRAALGNEGIPAGFIEMFRGTKSRAGWFDAFSMYIARELKNHPVFRDVFLASNLSTLVEASIDAALLLSRIEQQALKNQTSLQGLAEGVDRLQFGQAQIQSNQSKIQADVATLAARFDELTKRLPKISSATHIPVSTLLSILKAFGAGPVDAEPEQIEQMFLLIANEYRAQKEQVERHSNNDPVLTRLRIAAHAAMEGGDLARADQLLREASARGEVAVERLDRERQSLAEGLRRERRSQAEAVAARGLVATLSLDYLSACQRYLEAAVLTKEDSLLQWRYMHEAARLLRVYGDESRDSVALSMAIRVDGNSLKLLSKEEEPIKWAKTVLNTAKALHSRAFYSEDSDDLRLAILSYHHAKVEFDKTQQKAESVDAEVGMKQAVSHFDSRANQSKKTLLEEALLLRQQFEEASRLKAQLDVADES